MQAKGRINILMISETKIDETFPKWNSLTDRFSTSYRLDRGSKCGRIMLYIEREDIPSL